MFDGDYNEEYFSLKENLHFAFVFQSTVIETRRKFLNLLFLISYRSVVRYLEISELALSYIRLKLIDYRFIENFIDTSKIAVSHRDSNL